MNFFATCYRKLEGRRRWLLIGLLLLLLLCAVQLSQLRLEENISALLPDGNSQVALDFKLLQQAPFARKLVINISAADGIDSQQLLSASDALRAALPAELFHNAINGPGEQLGSRLLDQLGRYLPLLADGADLQRIEDQLAPEATRRHLQQDLAQLLQPQGIALKKQIRRDPLGFEALALQKLRYLNPVPEVRLEQGHFLSRNGHNSLILADTPIAITDSQGSRRLLEAFEQARQLLPPGISAELVSGHPYTLANASTIQHDMSRVLLASGVGILLLFVLFLRCWRTLAVYLLPLFSFVLALLVVSLCYERVSGITVGFGAVLLGITIDFGLHVYFALRSGDAARAELLRAVSRPVLFGALTSLAAFAVLLRSELPGQRQLALFAMTGIAAAVLLALLVLPHFIGKPNPLKRGTRQQFKRHIYDRFPWLRNSVLLLWLLVVVLAAVKLPQLSINGDLRRLGYQSIALQQNEAALSRAWGNMRGRALIFIRGENLETALERNEQVWQLLQTEDPAGLVSLAPLLPPLATQQQRLKRWQDFWTRHQPQLREQLLEQGKEFGFSAAAFDPFWSQLEHPPQQFGVTQLKALGMGDLLENLLLSDAHGYQVISLLPDRPELVAALEPKLSAIPGVNLVSQGRFGRQLSSEITADFRRFILAAGLAVLLLLVVLFRRLSSILLASLPVLTGLLVMLGGMAWLGLEMNLFNVVASILIIGLGVDYGIFMVCHAQQKEDLASSRAILLSGLTTLVGFGALVLAEHPALYSIGLSVLLGISAAVPTAVLVIPAFRPKRL